MTVQFSCGSLGSTRFQGQRKGSKTQPVHFSGSDSVSLNSPKFSGLKGCGDGCFSGCGKSVGGCAGAVAGAVALGLVGATADVALLGFGGLIPTIGGIIVGAIAGGFIGSFLGGIISKSGNSAAETSQPESDASSDSDDADDNEPVIV